MTPWTLLPKNPTRAQLMALPLRHWRAAEMRYDRLIIVPQRRLDPGNKHYVWMDLIGVKLADEETYAHIIGATTDLNWRIDPTHPKILEYETRRREAFYEPASLLRTDLLAKSKCVHFWLADLPGWRSRFSIPMVLSSTSVFITWEKES